MKFAMASCGGCRTCEMACSFHHTGKFIPALSSLKIIENEDDPGFSLVILERSDGQSIACDGCQDLEVPLCVQYCRESEDLDEMVKEFRKRIHKAKGKRK